MKAASQRLPLHFFWRIFENVNKKGGGRDVAAVSLSLSNNFPIQNVKQAIPTFPFSLLFLFLQAQPLSLAQNFPCVTVLGC